MKETDFTSISPLLGPLTADSLLQYSEKNEIYLVHDKSGAHYILKKLTGALVVFEMLKNLQHAYLPEIFDVIYENDCTIVIEEYIQGKPLNECQLSEKEAVKIILMLCDVLGCLHEHSILHRDVKPQNVILMRDGTIRLIDFDIARRQNKKNDGSRDTVLMVTEGYAPPEQYGFSQTDQRSDIFSLGITMREILGNAAQKKKYDRIIRQCVALNPSQRFSTMEELAAHIRGRSAFRRRLTFVAICLAFLIVATAILHDPMQQMLPAPENSTGNDRVEDGGLLNQPDFSAKSGSIAGSSKTGYDGELLFYPNMDASFIIANGKALVYDGTVCKMVRDLNKDGKAESFEISRDHPNGMRYYGYSQTTAVNFYNDYDIWTADVSYASNDIYGAYNDIGDLTDSYFVQITCYDLDRDGTDEVILSVGDTASEHVSHIYEYHSENEEQPFTYSGTIEGTRFACYTEDHKLYAPIGFQGNANIYQYENGTLTLIN